MDRSEEDALSGTKPPGSRFVWDEDDIEVTSEAATRLRGEFNVSGIMTMSIKGGGITRLLCDMDVCYNPLGRSEFTPISDRSGDWDPTEDHFPVLKSKGGERVAGNIRLAHRLCNRLDFGNNPGHVKQRFAAAASAAQWHKDEWEKSETNAPVRGEAEIAWRAMRDSITYDKLSANPAGLPQV